MLTIHTTLSPPSISNPFVPIEPKYLPLLHEFRREFSLAMKVTWVDTPLPFPIFSHNNHVLPFGCAPYLRFPMDTERKLNMFNKSGHERFIYPKSTASKSGLELLIMPSISYTDNQIMTITIKNCKLPILLNMNSRK